MESTAIQGTKETMLKRKKQMMGNFKNGFT